jgi:Ankyrin repeats (many copies)/Ankyrin repeat
MEATMTVASDPDILERFKETVRNRDAAGLRALLAEHPELQPEIDRPIFDTEPAVVFCRRDRAMVDALLDGGADINARSQFWGRTVGVLDDNPEMRAYLIQRGAVQEIDDFVAAVKAGDAAKVRALLAASSALRQHINRPLFPFGAQAIVAAKDNRAIVETLLEFGADINVKTDWWAGGFGVLDGTNPEQAAWLIERGAIVDIHAAAWLGMLDTVKEWLAKDPSLVHARGGDGQRPLHVASTKEIIDLLLDSGADINARDVDHHATAAQYKVHETDLCRHLIARGADVDIFMAIALNDNALIQQVIDADPACLTARIGQPGYAPVPPGHIYQWNLGANLSVLLVAAQFASPDLYKMIVRRSPPKEQFLAACRRRDEAAATKILAANPKLLDDLQPEDRAQLVEAADAHDLPAVELMLTLGFDINARDREGFTAVSHAALRGYVRVVRVLVDHGADLEIRSVYGGNALQSCQWGSLNFRDPRGDYPACAEALVQAGATVAYPDFGSDEVRARVAAAIRDSGRG